MPRQPQQLPQPRSEEIELGAVLHALSDPVRLEIVRALTSCGDERACGTFGLPVSKSTLTHHFRVLREAGIISQRQDGTSRLSTVRTQELEGRFPGVLQAILGAAPEFGQTVLAS